MGADSDDWRRILLDNAIHFGPFLAAIMLGVFLALWRWKRHRRVCALTLLGLASVLAALSFSIWFNTRIATGDLFRDMDMEDFMIRLRILQIISSALHGIGFILLIAAILIDRPRATSGQGDR